MIQENFYYSKKKDNSFLVALYLFQFSFLVVLNPVFPVSISTLLFSVLLILIYFFRQKTGAFMINKKIVFLSLSICIFLAMKSIQFPENSTEIFMTFVNFATICLLSLMFGNMKMDCQSFLEESRKISLFSFFMLVFLPLINIDLFGGYMRFGYALLPIVDTLFYSLVELKKNRVRYIVFYCISLVEMTIFGARGALFSHLLFVFFVAFAVYKPQKRIGLKILLAISALGGVYNLEKILYFIKDLFNRMGYRVYSIDKYIMQLQGGFEYASSGRNALWEKGMKVIREHPICGGRLGGAEGTEGVYYHNFFIQLGAEFGVPIVIIVMFILTYIILRMMLSSNKEGKYVFFMLFSIAFGRLLFSSSYWLRPELWLVVGMYCANTFEK